MKKKVTLFLVVISMAISSTFAQVASNTGIFMAKEFSKEIALFQAKKFLMYNVLGIPNDSKSLVKFEVDPLAASSSGELTSLAYLCKEKGKEGLILGFYGDRWNDAGVSFQSYAFKNLPKDSAIEMLSTIERVVLLYADYLLTGKDNANVYFSYGDITFLIYQGGVNYKIRVFWKGFDSTWEDTAFIRTKKRLLKKME